MLVGGIAVVTLVSLPTVAFWSFHWSHLNNILWTASLTDFVSASNWSSWAQLNLSPFPTFFQPDPMFLERRSNSSAWWWGMESSMLGA